MTNKIYIKKVQRYSNQIESLSKVKKIHHNRLQFKHNTTTLKKDQTKIIKKIQ